jgi:alpha-glucoside transport system ATP-binding protein
MNLFHGRIDGEGRARFVGPGVDIPVESPSHVLSDGLQVTLGVRPEDVLLGENDDETAIVGVVSLVEPLGSDVYINVELAPSVQCVARLASSAHVSEGQRVRLAFERERIHLFDADGMRLSQRSDVASTV